MGRKRADIIVISKCPDFKTLDKEGIIRKIKAAPDQKVFFSKINYGQVYSLQKSDLRPELNKENIILVTGICNTEHIENYIKKENKILHHFKFADHYKFKLSDLKAIHDLFGKFAQENPIILSTEKVAMRLLDVQFKEVLTDKPWFYQTIEV